MIRSSAYVEKRFRAMGTDVTVIALGSSATVKLLDAVEDLFARQEARFSRFKEDSELSRLNSGVRLRCSPDMRYVLQHAAKWHQLTDGDFDPAVLPTLVSAGYGVSFERIAAHQSSQTTARALTPESRHSFEDINIRDHRAFEYIQLPTGMQIDLSGIVKGWTVDRAAELLAPLEDFVIDAGGDIYAHGDSPDGAGWYVGLEDPKNPELDHAYILLQNSAVATSGTYRRNWKSPNGTHAHHLIDPHTGEPTRSGVIAVSIAGPSTEVSEVYAKTALIRGPVAGLAFLETAPGISGIMTLDDGSTPRTTNWQGLDAYTHGRALTGAGNA
jgi:thiamine biosynthesis lipoprotein